MVESEEGNLLTEDPGQGTQDWRDGISEEYREGTAKFGNQNDLAKGYLELEKSMGNKVKIPDEQSSEEEVSAFYEKIGRPSSADGYEINVAEGTPRDEEFEGVMRELAFKAGAPKVQFEALVKGYYEHLDAMLHRSHEEGERTLKTDWATDYDKNLEISRRAAREFGGDDFTKFLIDSRIGNHPVMAKFLLAVGKKNLDDTLIKGTAAEQKEAFVPANINSPGMYATGDDEYSQKARAYFEAWGYKY